MGQKVNPIGLRIGINRTWDTKWYANKKKFAKILHQDIAIEKLLRKKMNDAGVSKIEILRTANAVTINIHTSKPGVIIGRGGETIEALREELEKKFNNKFTVNIVEIKQPALDARLTADSIAKQIEKRISYRRAAKMAIEKALEAGAQGVKVRASGRLNGVEIAREEFYSKGKIPLHTLRSDIDYAYIPAVTTYGTIGVKVWIYKGDIFKRESGVVTQMTTERPTARKQIPVKETRPAGRTKAAKTAKK
ncbi:30S ribosomal protein S3 [Candidatus Peregrinibacteria bacterium]|nr:30S ribosomal protein S3 [Candidatus Peregrinibacteria bacterium]